ncbi:hypothetical protein SCUCBS95973_000753 [Sporothrix curviconia]|uniref:Uncharacterized protein n=1 Tax=Sporothrix curviconia TaxID=1260050 RepID=A0ABP0ASX4_9PEZI
MPALASKLLRSTPRQWDPWMAKKDKQVYSPVGRSSAEDGEDGAGTGEDTSMLHSRLLDRLPRRQINMLRRSLLLFPWITSLLLAGFSLYLVLLIRHEQQFPAFGQMHWSPNEFGPVREHITPLDISFTGGVSFNEKGEMYKPHPGKDTYVGASPLVDKEWDVLTFGGRYFIISDDEARETFGPGYQEYYNEQFGGYVIGLDMFHTLHCLNNLRKLIHPEYYPVVDDPRAKMHDSHCIDQLRQQVMCAGDATPVPVKWHTAAQRSYVESDVVHTCRNFRQLKNFTLERFYRSDARIQDMLIH